jgi:hypothetical protein
MTRRLLTSFAVLCALALCAPTIVSAATSSGTAAQAITDCNDHDTLTQHYSPAVLRQALAQMSADVREYTDCYDVIERQLFAELGKSTTTTPTTSTSSSVSSGSFLPTWLIVVIVLLVLAAVTFGAIAVRRGREEQPPGPGGPTEPGAGGPAGAPPGGAGGSPGPEDPGDPGLGEEPPTSP